VQAYPEQPCLFLPAASALGPGLDRPPLHPGLRRRDHALAAALPPPHVLKIRSLLEENYLPATANRMLSALRGSCGRAAMEGDPSYNRVR
jgi:hypothetical protein